MLSILFATWAKCSGWWRQRAEAGDLKASLDKLGLPTDGLDIDVSGDTVKVSGKAASQELKEKVILALGNNKEIAKVDRSIEAPTTDVASFYTVQKGDTLSAIAKKQYGSADKYMAIFEANKPMLKDPGPDLSWPGPAYPQTLSRAWVKRMRWAHPCPLGAPVCGSP